MVAGSALECFSGSFSAISLAFLAHVNACSCPPCLRHWLLSLRSPMDCSVMLDLWVPWDSDCLSSLGSCRKSRVDPQLRLFSRLCFCPLKLVQLLCTYSLFLSGPKQTLLSSQNEASKLRAANGRGLKKSWL